MSDKVKAQILKKELERLFDAISNACICTNAIFVDWCFCNYIFEDQTSLYGIELTLIIMSRMKILQTTKRPQKFCPSKVCPCVVAKSALCFPKHLYYAFTSAFSHTIIVAIIWACTAMCVCVYVYIKLIYVTNKISIADS